MEQIEKFISWYLSLFTDSDNRVILGVWGVTITTVTFIIVYVIKPLRKTIMGLFRKKIGLENNAENPAPSIDMFINEDDILAPIIDDDFNSKINLAKQRFLLGLPVGINIELIPNFSTDHYDTFRLQTLMLHLEDEKRTIQKKIEILLKTNDYFLRNTKNLQTAFISLLQDPPFNVSDKTKLDIYRMYTPKIEFPVYLSEEQMQEIAKKRNQTVEELIQQLRIPQFLAISIFPDEILSNEVIPALVREIYRIHTRFAFDFDTTLHWWNIGSYEVGLG